MNFIFPELGSLIPEINSNKVLFPQPLCPKIEIVLFLEKEKDRLLIIGLSGSKPKLKFSRTILLIFLPSARII